MKRIFILIACCFMFSSLYSQNFFAQVYTGYNRGIYKLVQDDDAVNDLEDGYGAAGSMPIGFRVGGGVKIFQAGFEFSFNALKTRFIFYDPFFVNEDVERFREDYKENYLGGFLRLATSQSGDTRVIGNFRFGTGIYLVKKDVSNFVLDGDKVEPQVFRTIEYENSLAISTGAGMSIKLGQSPIYLDLEATLNYNFKRTEKADDAVKDIVAQTYNVMIPGFHFGFSYNFFSY